MTDQPSTDKPLTIEQMVQAELPSPVLGKHWKTFLAASQAYSDEGEKKKEFVPQAYADFKGSQKLVQESIVRLTGDGALMLRQYLEMDPDEVPDMIIGAVNYLIAIPMRASYSSFLTQTDLLAGFLHFSAKPNAENPPVVPSNSPSDSN